jgi:hypothetical protein
MSHHPHHGFAISLIHEAESLKKWVLSETNLYFNIIKLSYMYTFWLSISHHQAVCNKRVHVAEYYTTKI